MHQSKQGLRININGKFEINGFLPINSEVHFESGPDSIPVLAEIRGIEEAKWVCPLSGQGYIINLIEIGGRVVTYEIKCDGGNHGEIIRDKASWE